MQYIYVQRPMDESVFDILDDDKNDTYVFIAPEVIE